MAKYDSDAQNKENLLLAIDILKYYPAKTARKLSANFHTVIDHSTSFFNNLLNQKIKIHSSSKLNITELKKSLSPTLNSLNRALALITASQTQTDELLKQQAATASNAPEKVTSTPAYRVKTKTKSPQLATAVPATNNKIVALHKKALDQLSNQALKDFEVHNHVLIPLSSNIENAPNAQMLCEFRKQANGEVLFLVWNTGIGSNFHQNTDHGETSKMHSPVRVFRCANANALNKSDMKAFIERCLAPSLPNFDGKETIKPEDYYNAIISQIPFLSGVEIDSTPFYNTGVVAEPEGSSAWKVIETYIQNNAIQKDDANEIDYEILKDTFENLLNNYEDEIKGTPQFQQELDEIASLFAAKLQLVAKDRQFSMERQKIGVELLTRAKHLISAAVPHAPIDPAHFSQFTMPRLDTPVNNRPTNWVDFYPSSSQELPSVESNEYTIPPTPEFKNIDQANEYMGKLLSTTKTQKKLSLNMLLQFEKVLNSLPLTEAFIKEPHKVNAHQFALTLQEFMSTYINACKDVDNVPFGERQLAVYSAVALLELIANEHFSQNKDILEKLYATSQYNLDFADLLEKLPAFSHPVLQYLDLIPQKDTDKLPDRHKFFERCLRSHYFTTTDNQTLERIKLISDIFKKNPSNPSTEISFIDLIASKNPSLKQACGFTGNAKNDMKEAGYYLYSNKNTLKSQYPDEIRDASFCLAYNAMSVKASSFIGGHNYHFFDYDSSFLKPSDNLDERNWGRVYYNRETKSKYLYSNISSYKDYDKNHIQTAHTIADQNLNNDFNIDLDTKESYQPKLTPNNVQIKLHAKSIDRKLDLRRIFSQIGTTPGSQIVATIEYLQANATNIGAKDPQQIIFMLLFDKGLIANEAKENPAAILKLLEIIDSSIQFYANDELKQPLAFYLKINAFLKKVLLELPHDTNQLQKILTKSRNVSDLLDTYKQKLTEANHKNEDQLQLLKDFQAIKIIELNNQLTANGKLSEAELTQFYVLNFQLRFAKELAADHFLNKEVTYAQHAIKSYAMANPKLTTDKILLDVIQELDVEFNTQKYQFTFPHAKSDIAQIDLINATIISRGAKASPLPREVYANETFKELFGNDDILAQKTGYSDYAFQYKGEHYRLQFNNYSYNYAKSTFVAQKQMAKANEAPEWYQLINSIHSTSHIRNIFPSTLINNDYHIWESKNGDVIIVNKTTNAKVAIYSTQEQAAYVLDNQGARTKRLISRTALSAFGSDFSFLTKFESADFIELTEDLVTRSIHINLPRYGLSFTSKNIDGHQYFVCDDDQETCLLKTNASPIDELNQALVFANIPKENAPQKTTKTLLAKVSLSSTVNENAIRTKHYATYFHVGTEYEPASAADAYYLALLELSKGNTEKGYQIISKYVHMFLGSPAEIENLLAIATLGDTNSGTDLDLGSLNKQAAKMLACYTIVQYLRQGHTLDDLIDHLKKQKPTVNNMLVEGVQNFKSLAMKNLKEYLILKDYLPKTMHLKRREILSVMDYAKHNEENFYLDIQHKKTELKNLVKEYQSLTKLNKNKSVEVNSRIEVIKEKLLKEYHFTPKVEQFAPKQYDLTNRKENAPEDGFHSGNIVTNLKISIDELSLNTQSQTIGANLIGLFHEAASDPEKETKLHQFLNAKLLALVHQTVKPNNEQMKLEFDDKLLENADMPDFLINLVKSLKGIKIPELFEVPAEAHAYALLKAMIADKRKVIDTIHLFETKGKDIIITNSVGESRYCYSVNEAVAFALAHQTVTFDIPQLQAKDGSPTRIRFYNSIENAIFFDEKISDKTNLSNLDTLLTNLGLKEKLAATTSSKMKDGSNIFSLNPKNKEAFYDSLINESNQDYQKGRMDNIHQDNLQKQRLAELSVATKRQELQHAIEHVLDNNQAAFEKMRQDILTLLKKGPSDPKAQLEWQLSLQAKTRRELTIEDAFKLFSNRSISSIKKKCHLNDQDAKKLLHLTGQYLLEGTQKQQYRRILALINKLELPLSANDQRTLINQLGTELSLRRCYDINKYPDILLFEYLDNKMVYPKQINMLDKLLKQKGDGSYESVAIQLIMGGGKSKVLLPLLAKMRANGTNLSIIEVPGALLETNFFDLHAVSKKLNQKSHLFKFDRNVLADSEYFYRMRQHLQSVVAHKEYIVTTRESIQSIELKYIDVLTNPIDDLVEWEKQITYLDEIVNLIKNRGDAIIDEIDLNLRTRDQLIYTVGEGKPTPKFLTDAIIGLYKSFANINHIVNGAKVNLHDVVSLQAEKPSEDDLQLMLAKLKKELLTSKQSPIANIVANLKADELKEVDAFLSNQFTAIPNCFKGMSTKEKSILAVYKEHLHRLLPLSLSRKLYENFGLPQDPLKLGMQKEIAIPYVSNNTPNESAKFQNHLLTMNYTIQAHLAQALSVNVLQTLLIDFKSRYTAELNLNAYAKTPSHHVEILFQSMFGKAIDLNTLDTSDMVKVTKIHDQFKNSLKVKEYCLGEYILPAVLSNPLTICSNDQNHVSAYRSVVGFTGTDYNYRCFHDSITRENTDSFGTDGQTVSHLNSKERYTHVLEQNNSQVLFDLLKDHKDIDNVRAFIDVGAQFKGVSNRDVANQLAAFYFNKPDVAIKHILYFNNDNVLCALKVNEHPEHEEPLVLGSSENIEGKLDCQSHQYFSYYDQAHTTGTDIKQAPGTIGITTISEKTMLRDVLQAVMRLRDLKDSHHIEFAVMQSLVKEQPNIKKWDVKTILNVCLQYQAKTLMQEHLSSAFNKINNVVRQDILGQIRNSTSIMDKAILSDAYKQLLYQLDNATYFDKYGMPETMVETESLLKAAQEKAIQQWKTCLQSAQRKISHSEVAKLDVEMKKIITKSVKICAQKQMSALTGGSENQVIAQIEVQNERQNEIETEQQVQDARLKPRSYQSWEKVDLATYKPGKNISLMSLEQIAKSHRIHRNWKFDENLQASVNYYETCKSGPSDKLNTFKKPLFYVMNVQTGGQLNKILITQQEAQELRGKLKQTKMPEGRYVWVDTPSGIPYSGVAPKQSDKHVNEARLAEQIQFFNADVIYLAANYGSLTWFKENAQNKFTYLQNELLPLHPSKGSSLALLKETMLQDGKIDPATDGNETNLLTDKSWQRLHNAYFYPEDDNHPKHSKEEYARLQSYVRHRDNVRFYSLRSKWQEYKKAIGAFFSRCKNAIVRKAINLALQYFSPRLLDYVKAKRKSLAFYSILSTVIGVAQMVSWFFALGFGMYLGLASTIGTAILVGRAAWCLVAKRNYDSITKIENLTNSSELYALKTGVESSTYLGYLKGLFRPTCYFYPKAYYAGLEIGCDTTEGVLANDIKRKVI